MALSDIPKGRFPLRFEEYSKMHDKMGEAASRFAALGYSDLAGEIEAARSQLWRAWDKIVTAEREGR